MDELNDTRARVRDTCTHDSAKLIVDEEEKQENDIFIKRTCTQIYRGRRVIGKKSTFYEVQDVNRILLVTAGCDANVSCVRGTESVCMCVCLRRRNNEIKEKKRKQK